MQSKITLLIALFVMIAGCFLYGQQPSENQSKSPSNLYPQPGPGDRMIVGELQRANALLEENNRLLSEHNQILKQILSKTNQQQPQPQPSSISSQGH